MYEELSNLKVLCNTSMELRKNISSFDRLTRLYNWVWMIIGKFTTDILVDLLDDFR
jgi:hypothetical protein